MPEAINKTFCSLRKAAKETGIARKELERAAERGALDVKNIEGEIYVTTEELKRYLSAVSEDDMLIGKAAVTRLNENKFLVQICIGCEIGGRRVFKSEILFSSTEAIIQKEDWERQYNNSPFPNTTQVFDVIQDPKPTVRAYQPVGYYPTTFSLDQLPPPLPTMPPPPPPSASKRRKKQ